jgi:hypothetical protein
MKSTRFLAKSHHVPTHRIHVWYIYANIWGILMVNVTIYSHIYSIHGSYGLWFPSWYPPHLASSPSSRQAGSRLRPLQSTSERTHDNEVTTSFFLVGIWTSIPKWYYIHVYIYTCMYVYIYIYKLYTNIYIYMIHHFMFLNGEEDPLRSFWWLDSLTKSKLLELRHYNTKCEAEKSKMFGRFGVRLAKWKKQWDMQWQNVSSNFDI